MSDFKATFRQAEIPREELELPRLHFVVMDNWIDVIGEKALFAWLKMYTWGDRSGAKENPNLWNESVVPKSLTKVMKSLGVGRTTFYNQIIKPLWNFGLIDLVEYEDSENKGTKPINIVVYKYPQNRYELSVKPLEKVRDYDKDYSSEAKTFNSRRKKDVVSESESLECTQEVHPPVLIQYRGVYSDSTGGCTEIVHNNIFNNINNNLNNILIDEDEDEEKQEMKKTDSVESESELVKYLVENNITAENARIFENACIKECLINFDVKDALKAIEWALKEFKADRCKEPYKYATGRLKRMLDPKIKDVKNEVKYNKSKNKTEIVPEWLKNKNREVEKIEEIDDVSIDFEAEREKILAKLS